MLQMDVFTKLNQLRLGALSCENGKYFLIVLTLGQH